PRALQRAPRVLLGTQRAGLRREHLDADHPVEAALEQGAREAPELEYAVAGEAPAGLRLRHEALGSDRDGVGELHVGQRLERQSLQVRPVVGAVEEVAAVEQYAGISPARAPHQLVRGAEMVDPRPREELPRQSRAVPRRDVAAAAEEVGERIADRLG